MMIAHEGVFHITLPFFHYSDVIMSTMAHQITSASIIYSTVCSGADKRRHQSYVSLAFVGGIHRWPVSSTENVLMQWRHHICCEHLAPQILPILRRTHLMCQHSRGLSTIYHVIYLVTYILWLRCGFYINTHLFRYRKGCSRHPSKQNDIDNVEKEN